MSVRIATFNAENLMRRFETDGFQNDGEMDRALSLFDIQNEAQFRRLEEARMIALADDTRQLTALAIAATKADIICLQEVDNLDVLNAFERNYLYKMIGRGYVKKILVEGNDSRGIDVAVMMREVTRDGEAIECINVKSHAAITFDQFDLHNEALGALGIEPHDKIFRRDCLEVDLSIGGRSLTLFVTHLKSMSGGRNGVDGRTLTMPVRVAEVSAIRRIISNRFGEGQTHNHNWLICGDLNDYQQKIDIIENDDDELFFDIIENDASALNVLLSDGFCENLVARRDALERWTLYHTRGPEERHLCQLDYMLASPAMAARNLTTKPDIIRKGQPYRVPFPTGQNIERFPRVGWDRPKASDHCPVAMTFKL